MYLFTVCTIVAMTLAKMDKENDHLYPLEFDFNRDQEERSCKFCAKQIGDTYIYDRLRVGKQTDENRHS